MDARWWAAYLAAEYRVQEPALTLRVGDFHPALDAFCRAHGAQEWAFLTAWNPHSRPLPSAENELRQALLRRLLEGHVVCEGESVAPDGSWRAEESLLIIGISRTDAMRIGRLFEQNAVVAGQTGAHAELIWTA